MVEKRDCKQDFCIPECPSYNLTNLTKQDNNPSRFVAEFSVQKVNHPIGKLKYQILRLQPKQLVHETWPSTTVYVDGEAERLKIDIQNLMRKVTYLPIYEFHLEIDSTNRKDMTMLKWECTGQVY